VNPRPRRFVDHPDVRALFVAGMLLLVACAPPRTTSTADATATSAASAAATSSVPTAAASTPAGRLRPAFLSYQFTDVRDGATFRLTDFAGKTVLVIGMAVW
jgi:hypothetical protein